MLVGGWIVLRGCWLLIVSGLNWASTARVATTGVRLMVDTFDGGRIPVRSACLIASLSVNIPHITSSLDLYMLIMNEIFVRTWAAAIEAVLATDCEPGTRFNSRPATR